MATLVRSVSQTQGKWAVPEDRASPQPYHSTSEGAALLNKMKQKSTTCQQEIAKAQFKFRDSNFFLPQMQTGIPKASLLH